MRLVSEPTFLEKNGWLMKTAVTVTSSTTTQVVGTATVPYTIVTSTTSCTVIPWTISVSSTSLCTETETPVLFDEPQHLYRDHLCAHKPHDAAGEPDNNHEDWDIHRNLLFDWPWEQLSED